MDEFGKGCDAAQLFRRQLHEQAEQRDEILLRLVYFSNSLNCRFACFSKEFFRRDLEVGRYVFDAVCTGTLFFSQPGFERRRLYF